MLALIGRRIRGSSTPLAMLVLTTLLFRPVIAQALEVGQEAPNFSLHDINGKTVSLSDFKGKTVVLEWFNAGCPFVMKHYRGKHMQALQKEYTDKGVVWLTINSTNSEHKDFLDAAAATSFRKEHSVSAGTYLADQEGTVGKAYGAKTTPHFFIINDNGLIAYQGAIDDDSDTGSDPLKARNYVQEALNSLLDKKPVAVAKTAPYGCNVKYAL